MPYYRCRDCEQEYKSSGEYNGLCIRCDGDLGRWTPPLSKNAIDLDKPPMVLDKKSFSGLVEMLIDPYVGKRKYRDVEEAVRSLRSIATIKTDKEGSLI